MMEGFCYLVKEEYFELFSEGNNFKDKSYSRPSMMAFQDALREEILWMVPLSSKTSEWKAKINRNVLANMSNDGCEIKRFNGVEHAVIYMDMFPVLKDHINREFTLRGQHMKVEGRYKNEVIAHSRKIAILLVHGRKLSSYSPNVKRIYNELCEILDQREKI